MKGLDYKGHSLSLQEQFVRENQKKLDQSIKPIMLNIFTIIGNESWIKLYTLFCCSVAVSCACREYPSKVCVCICPVVCLFVSCVYVRILLKEIKRKELKSFLHSFEHNFQ